MKHLLNNISEEEKNRIREQHEGGMNLAIDNFKKLVETKLGDAKPYLNESKETCEQCGGMMVEGECVEQCGSMKEEELGESLGLKVKKSEQDVANIIKRMVMKLDDGVKKDLKSLDNFDNVQRVAFFNRLMANLNEGISEELEEQNAETLPQKNGIKLGPLDDNEIRELVKQIADCLDDNGKELIFRLNKDKSNHETFFDMMMSQIGRFVDDYGKPGPQG